GLFGTTKIKKTLDMALQLHPGARHIAVIAGSSKVDRFLESEVRKALQTYEDQFDFIFLTDLAMDDLLVKVARLPENTVGFYALTLMDSTGKEFIPQKILPHIAQASNAPLYGLWDTFLGAGIVGGCLFSAEVGGARAAEIGLRILRGKKPSDIPVPRDLNRYMFDWRQLRRWGVSEGNLPPGSIVRYKELSSWDIYKWRIILFMLIVLMGSVVYVKYKTKIYKKRIEEQKKIQQLLEEKVNERTVFLQNANAELKQEINKRKGVEADLHQAKIKAEAANRAKGDFLAGMSHELRTPMNAILGFSQLIHHDPDITNGHREHLSIIQRSGRHLLSIIDDVLDMSKIDAGKTTLNDKKFNLHNLLNDLEGMLGFQAGGKGLFLTIERASDIPRYIRSDEIKLRQVLINLIGNAIKFTMEGGVVVRVEKHPAVHEKSDICHLHFEIEDTGPGFTPEEMDCLFEAFVQTKAGRQMREGCGLGLPISRRFVQLMGGDIRGRCRIGKGATFDFDIRVHVVNAADMETPAPGTMVVSLEAGQSMRKILIADDHPDNRKLFLKLLEPLGFDLREAADGREAVEIWRSWLPDLIWMDVLMPVMGGYEAVEIIRDGETSIAAELRTVIIAQSASAIEEEREAALEAGCDDFLRTPFRESELFELMGRHLGVRFVYEDIETENETPTGRARVALISPEHFHGIPDELLKRLKKAAIETDMAKMEMLLEKLRETHPELADCLGAFAYDFEYGAIVQMIEDVERRKSQGDAWLSPG
ncbi:MAG: response regulator, partial [Desulfobacterales bacterium]|nr:response regulator [Desulfobacterales bacterium]